MILSTTKIVANISRPFRKCFTLCSNQISPNLSLRLKFGNDLRLTSRILMSETESHAKNLQCGISAMTEDYLERIVYQENGEKISFKNVLKTEGPTLAFFIRHFG